VIGLVFTPTYESQDPPSRIGWFKRFWIAVFLVFWYAFTKVSKKDKEQE